MPKLKTGASARVTIQVEVRVGSSWGAGTGIEQIHKQAVEEALAIVQRQYERPEEIMASSKGHGWPVRIIGEPKVTAVLVETERE